MFFSHYCPDKGRSLYYGGSRLFNIFALFLGLMVVYGQTRPQSKSNSLVDHRMEKCDCHLHRDQNNRANFVCCDGSQDEGNVKLSVILVKMLAQNIIVDTMLIRHSFAWELFQHDLNIDMLQLDKLNNKQLFGVDVKPNDHIKKLLITKMDGHDISFLDKIQTNWKALEMLHLDDYHHNQDEPNSPKFHLFKSPFSSEHKLESLTMNHCNIESLAKVDLLKNVESLRTLSLAHNKLTTIDNLDFFPSQENSQFWFLDLGYNQLETLPEEWPLLNNVTHIHLEHNSLTKLPDDLYQRDFKEFWFQGNPADCGEIADRFGEKIPPIFVCYPSKFPSPTTHFPDPTETTMTEPTITEPTITKPTITESTITESTITKRPATTEPTTVEPTTPQRPATTEPSTMEPTTPQRPTTWEPTTNDCKITPWTNQTTDLFRINNR